LKLISHNTPLEINTIESILFDKDTLEIDSNSLKLVEESHNFLLDFAKDKVIYGINTGFGPMAQYKIAPEKIKELQYNLIRSHASGTGQNIPDSYVKAAMLVRMKAIMQGKSGIHPSTILLLKDLINNNIYPYIPEHGGVGASGDLVQLSHLALILIGEGEVFYENKRQPTKTVFEKLGLTPITIKLREGLSLINGTSVMTGIGLINIIKAKQLLNWSLIASAMLNEIVESFDDHYSAELNNAKKHNGQQLIANTLRKILKDSKLTTNRTKYFYDKNITDSVFKKKVQEYYSLRCLPQILGPVYDTLKYTETILIDETNSVSDNPIIDLETQNVYHGGNFHGDYVSLEMDKLKLAVTRLSMLFERQLSFLLNPKLNEILPPFINLGTLGLNLGMQGVQFTATSTVAENQTLSGSMYIHSIPTNNDNQDIVSMGTNAAMLTKKVIDNAYQVLSIEMMALAQAVDYLKIDTRLSSTTKKTYDTIRQLVPKFIDDSPKYKDIQAITDYLFTAKIEL
jgi:histidine ammonia-lyase